MPLQHFRLPDVGEGLTEAEVVTWKVAVGDQVAVNAVICEIETAKSLVELPSPFAGRVSELLVPEGRTIEVGTAIVAVDVAGPAGADGAGGGATGRAGDGATDGGRESVLVGYGPGRRASRRRRRETVAPVSVSADAPARAQEAPGDANAAATTVSPSPEPSREQRGERPLAAPPVRRLAKDRGVDLAAVAATGSAGNVTRADVLAHAARPPVDQAPPAGRDAASGGSARTSGTGGETRIPLRGVRRAMADAMVRSAGEAPHASLAHTVDVTRTMKLVARLRADRTFEGVRVSPLLLACRAVVVALGRTPEMGARWDGEAGEIVVPAHVNLGIAAATPRGLVVPNVKGAESMTLVELARALGELTTTAREGRTTPAAMAGGTFTITNIGAFGIETGSPILNPGETGILALGAFAQRPWVHKDRVRARWVTRLGLSVDHRVVDGAQAAQFLADVAAVLERPSQALVWG